MLVCAFGKAEMNNQEYCHGKIKRNSVVDAEIVYLDKFIAVSKDTLRQPVGNRHHESEDEQRRAGKPLPHRLLYPEAVEQIRKR